MAVPPIRLRKFCDLAEVVKELFMTYNGDYEAGGTEVLSRKDQRRVKRGRIYNGGRCVMMKREPEAFVLSGENSFFSKDIYSRAGALVLYTDPVSDKDGGLVFRGLTIECTPEDREIADFISDFWKDFSEDGPVKVKYKDGY